MISNKLPCSSYGDLVGSLFIWRRGSAQGKGGPLGTWIYVIKVRILVQFMWESVI